ncbi:MAG TPA: PepSY domain-containing protein [Hyphomicrobiaceae bacterium]|nr:PepSY domain-containing protein [Hyphomicrobiaceae bacterium]
MIRFAAAFAIAAIVATPALADDQKPSADEAKKVTEVLATMGCSGHEDIEKETRSDGGYHFEIDDAVCDGAQYDIKLDKDFKLISKERE